jgi:hypothetical protein
MTEQTQEQASRATTIDIAGEVGATAGRVWHYLSEHDSVSPIKLKAALEIPNSLMYLALGWLAREDKVVISLTGHSYRISLKR